MNVGCKLQTADYVLRIATHKGSLVEMQSASRKVLHFASHCAMVEERSSIPEGEPPVKWLRELLGMSQFEFAVLVGVTPSTVSRWESGRGTPSFTPKGFKSLLRALENHGMTLNDLPDDLSLAGRG